MRGRLRTHMATAAALSAAREGRATSHARTLAYAYGDCRSTERSARGEGNELCADTKRATRGREEKI